MRAPPIFVDAERATDATKQRFAESVRVLQQAHGPLHCVAIRDATVVGQGSVITPDGVLLWESASEFLAHGHTPDGLGRGRNDRWRLRSEPVRSIEAPCLLVKRPWFRNFGHWLVDCATLLALFADDVRSFGWTIVTGVYDDPAMDRIVKETLLLLAPEAPVLRQPDGEAWQFADLRYAMPVHVPPQFKLPAAIRQLRELVFQSQDAPQQAVPSRPRRIYLSRQDVGVRRIANEADLGPLLSALGFETVYLNGRSLSDQALLFRNAEAIIGVKGAALANIIFCKPPCSVMVLSPADFPDPFFWDIAGQSDLRYAELFGDITTSRPPGLNDFVVNPVALARMLGAVLGSGTPGHGLTDTGLSQC
jgi:capsular polysaccharide biosynthesis protein